MLGCAGDTPTLETLAAAALLREHLPELKVRVINVVDLMRLQSESEHPHGLSDPHFDALFTVDKPIVFAYHGYPWLIHRLTYRRANHGNLHVRGYKEEGTTTTPFDMVMLNDLDRFHLVIDVIDRVPGLADSSRAPAPGDGGVEASGPRLHSRLRRRPAGDPRLDVDWLSVLVVNAGSTSLKLSVVGANDSATPVESLVAVPDGVDVVGHRVVHGGTRFRDPVVVDDDVVGELARLSELAPLHNGPALHAIEAARAALPDRLHAAVFDTAFHASLPDVASTYAIPAQWRQQGLRRFGFHGLSVQWAAEQVPVARLVVCHLGGRLLGDGGRGREVGRHDDGPDAA